MKKDHIKSETNRASLSAAKVHTSTISIVSTVALEQAFLTIKQQAFHEGIGIEEFLWKKVSIRWNTDDKEIWKCKQFAISKSNKKWDLIHLPSKSIFNGITRTTMAKAKMAAEFLMRSKVNWNIPINQDSLEYWKQCNTTRRNFEGLGLIAVMITEQALSRKEIKKLVTQFLTAGTWS